VHCGPIFLLFLAAEAGAADQLHLNEHGTFAKRGRARVVVSAVAEAEGGWRRARANLEGCQAAGLVL
jgi:hypothetical protein